ncbi:MAG: S49 family peptidase, partial [Candidatus Kapaibacteriota bacterium]
MSDQNNYGQNSGNSGNFGNTPPPFPPNQGNFQGNNQGYNPNFPPFPPNYNQPKKRKWWIPLVIVMSVIVLFFVVIFAIIGSVFSDFNFEEKPVKVSKNSVLYINFAGGVQEYAQNDNPFAALSGGSSKSASFIEHLRAIEIAKNDDNIKGIYIYPKGNIGFAKSLELIEAIEEFKKSGKFVYAFIEAGTETDYMNIVSADKIYMPTEGMIELNGFGTSALFMKGLFDKIGVNFHVQGFEDFKSAGDSYNKTKFSDSSRYQLEVLFQQRHNEFVNLVAKNRKMTPETINTILSRGIYTADSIKALGFVDELISENNLKERIKVMVNGKKATKDEENEKDEKDDKLSLITVASYINSENLNIDNEKVAPDSKQIAIINSVGAISSGKNSSSPFGGGDYEIKSGTFVEQLKKAREDKDVKAIILRIDSPGGSVIASDEMWEEIMKTKKVKPIIASMSDVAASGGYYMAMACDKIVAHPSTITGSIGVILAIPNVAGLMNNLGLTSDTISTTPAAQFMNGMYAYTDKDKAQLYNLSKGIYYRFLSRVAESRGKTVEEI